MLPKCERTQSKYPSVSHEKEIVDVTRQGSLVLTQYRPSFVCPALSLTTSERSWRHGVMYLARLKREYSQWSRLRGKSRARSNHSRLRTQMKFAKPPDLDEWTAHSPAKEAQRPCGNRLIASLSTVTRSLALYQVKRRDPSNLRGIVANDLIRDPYNVTHTSPFGPKLRTAK